jgi:hypothetical protein
MKRTKKTAAVAAALTVTVVAGGLAGLRYFRGPTGSSVLYGGTLPAATVPDFPSHDAAVWANGDATTLASLRGSPVLLEFWSPS